MAQQIASRVKAAEAQRVAILPLQDLRGAQSDIGEYISEELSTSLAIHGVDVVERGLLQRVLTELKLQETGAIDPVTAKRVGKIAAADVVVVGTVTALPTTLNVNCRVIATETGRVITGARTKITIDADVNALRKIVPEPRYIPLSDNSGPPATKPKPKPKPSPLWTSPDLRVIVDSAERRGDYVILILVFENIGNDHWNRTFWHPYLVDEHGNRAPVVFEDDVDIALLSITPGTRSRRRATCKIGESGTRYTLISDGWSLKIGGIVPVVSDE